MSDESRFYVLNGSISAHCCFDASVCDRTRPVMIGGEHYKGQHHQLCECFDREEAEQIRLALELLELLPQIECAARQELSYVGLKDLADRIAALKEPRP